jgi:hypothetical protein
MKGMIKPTRKTTRRAALRDRHRRRLPRAAAPHRTPRGSRLRLTLSETADVRILIERALSRRPVGNHCQAPTRTTRTGVAAPATSTPAPSPATARPPGANTIPFSGRIGTRALAPGRYRATITATDAAGNRSAVKRASFSIARR